MSSKILANTSILVTRPKNQARELCQCIEELGGKAIILSTIAIEPVLFSLTEERLAQFDITIFLSQNAVHKTFEQIQYFPEQSIVLAIGQATKKALRKYNISVAAIPKTQFNSEGLLKLDILNHVNNKKIAIFAGENGRDRLANELRLRGALVEKIAVYKRICPKVSTKTLAQLNLEKIDIIICLSNESLANLVAIMGQERQTMLLSCQLLSLSLRQQELAKAYGFNKRIIQAENASVDAVIKALIAYKEKNNDS